ncbi:hypothetical protein NMG60_11017973 [Bertholletia excelsa]
MAPRIKISLLVFLFLLVYSSSGIAEGFSDNTNPLYLIHKVATKMNSRKLMTVSTVLDYDYTGPNTKHDPRKGKGGGGRNP